MDTYILQKDLPEIKAGATYKENESGYYMLYECKEHPFRFDIFPKKVVENNPEWFKKEEPKQWQIVSMKYRDCIMPYAYCTMFPQGWEIHSVKRLSDNEVFTVGDETEGGKIQAFKILDDSCNYQNGDIAFSIADIKFRNNIGVMCSKTPLFNRTLDQIKRVYPKPLPKEEPLPIKVEVNTVWLNEDLTKDYTKGWYAYQFSINTSIHPAQFPLIKKAIEKILNNEPPSLPLPLIDDREVFSINDIASCYESPHESPLYRQFMYQLYRLLESKISMKHTPTLNP